LRRRAGVSRSSRPALLGAAARSRGPVARTVSADTSLQLLREAHGGLDAGPRPFAAFLDASGIWDPTAAFTAAEAHMPSATQQFAALTEQTAARLVRGPVRRAVADVVRVVRERCRALR
ncbi:hypothetical protein ACWC3X_43585, partial [Streptomyces populi]